MNVWGILEIEPTSDKKDIKLAYSKKLKVTRPDEKPKEFQQLHKAYKDALRLAEGQNPAIYNFSEHPHDIIEDSYSHVESSSNFSSNNETSSQPSDNAENEQKIQGEVEIEFYKLIDLAQSNIQQPAHEQTKEQWEPVMDSPFIFDPEFNFHLGTQLFVLIAHYNHANKKKSRRVPSKILNYLNNIFTWSNNQDYLLQAAGEKQANAIFYYLKDHRDFDIETKAINSLVGGDSLIQINSDVKGNIHLDQYLPGRFQRLVAFILDLIIVYPIIYFIHSILKQYSSSYSSEFLNSFFYVFIPVLTLYAFLTESSPLQATFGKYLLKLRVVDKGFNRLSYRHTAWRSSVFGVTLIFSTFTIIINYLLGKRLIHDRASRSLAIHYKRTKQKLR